MLKPFQEQGIWLKGNMHTHTNRSDGRVSPADRIAAYRDNGYDFLALTDHDLTDTYHDDRLVMITGSEWLIPLADRFYHLVALDVPGGFDLPREISMQDSIDAVRAAGGLAVLAHPYWCGLTLPDMQSISGYFALEVYNSTCQFGIGKGTSSVHWDNYLAAGGRCFGLAVDDCHFAEDAFGGWIVAKAASKERSAIVDAIKAGSFYASCGPTISDVQLQGNKLSVDCSDAVAINFICRNSTGLHCVPTGGEFLDHAELELRDFFGYVRIEVVDVEGKVAWTNPLYLDELDLA